MHHVHGREEVHLKRTIGRQVRSATWSVAADIKAECVVLLT